MKTTLLCSAIALALTGAAVYAAEPAQPLQIASAETFEQQCGRWADFQNLKDNVRAEYITDCLRELHHPDKPDQGGDDD